MNSQCVRERFRVGLSLLREVILLELIVDSLKVPGVSWKGPSFSPLLALVNIADSKGITQNSCLFLLLFLQIVSGFFYKLCLRMITLLAHLKGEWYKPLAVNCHTGRRQ